MARLHSERKGEWKEEKKEGKNQSSKIFIDAHICFEILYFTERPAIMLPSWEKTTGFVQYVDVTFGTAVI